MDSEIDEKLNTIMKDIDNFCLDIINNEKLTPTQRRITVIAFLGTITHKYYFDNPDKKLIWEAYNNIHDEEGEFTNEKEKEC